MNEHSLHQIGISSTRTVARRRRVHAARRRVAGVRARMAEVRAATAMQQLDGSEQVRNGNVTR